MTIVRKGAENQEFPITDEDFSTVMRIQNGKGSLVVENPNLDPDLVEKFCILNKGNKYKEICPTKTEKVLTDADEKDVIVIKQAFALLAMYFLVCPTARGKLGKNMLYYVQDVNRLSEQPWVSLAMEALKNGIKSYQEGKGAQKNIGGCVLFLQLYCMRKSGFLVQKINEDRTKEFSTKWMDDYASGNVVMQANKKLVADKICRNLKSMSTFIKAEYETMDLHKLLELNTFTENCVNKFSAQQSLESIGPFNVCSSTIGARDKKLLQWVYNEDEKLEQQWVASLQDGLAITKGEMRSFLNLHSWLSDTIVSYVAEYLCARAFDSSPNPKRWYFPTSFESETRGKDRDMKKFCEQHKWTSLKKTPSVDLNLNFGEVEQFFVPVIRDGHFNLVVVDIKTSSLELWDPIKKDKESTAKELLVRVADGLEETFGWEKGRISNFKTSVCDVRQQDDWKDCGVYVCHFMEYPDQAKNKAYEWHSAEERCHLAIRILTSKDNCCLKDIEEMSSAFNESKVVPLPVKEDEAVPVKETGKSNSGNHKKQRPGQRELNQLDHKSVNVNEPRRKRFRKS